jgi:hypothetical protein
MRPGDVLLHSLSARSLWALGSASSCHLIISIILLYYFGFLYHGESTSTTTLGHYLLAVE